MKAEATAPQDSSLAGDEVTTRNPVEELGEEFLERRRAGESVSISDYATAHPDLADEINYLFPAMLAMERFKGSRSGSSGRPLELRLERPEQLGDYRIIREIGRGGMGVVYEAEQQSLGRHVAVKVLPQRTFQSTRQLERFHREARTAARLHHTNIVQVFGVGEQAGLHYYVMQRIEGVALDEVISGALQPTDNPDAGSEVPLSSSRPLREDTAIFGSANEETPPDPTVIPADEADEEQPSAPDLTTGLARRDGMNWKSVVEIGIQVAEALDYAHSQGVMHRDIKPSNLLLDPQGTVRVTDFGLAILLESESAAHADVGGTLRYMAPEHLQGEQDARSDIYSLGLTLYELLTLRPAFDEPGRSRMIERILRGAITPPRRVRPQIPRDLEAIVLRAVARDPARRYETAAALAEDLRRFHEDRPVRARRIGPLGRLWRWTRRNPAVATLSATLLLVVLSSFILVSAKWQVALAESRRAEANLALALESLDGILERFGGRWMSHPTVTETEGEDGEETTSAGVMQMAVSSENVAVLEDALRFYDRFAQNNPTSPQLQRETAKVHRRVGDIYQRLGQHDRARVAYERSLRLLMSERTEDDPIRLLQIANTRNQRGLALQATGRFEEAAWDFNQAQSLLSRGPCAGLPECQAELARTYNNLGQTHWRMREHDEARNSQKAAVGILEDLVRQCPDEADYRLDLARSYRTYYPLAAFVRRDGAVSVWTAGIDLLEELVSDFPDVPDYQCELSEMLSTTAFRSKRPGNSVENFQRAVDLARALCEQHPSIPRYRGSLARGLRQLAGATRRIDRQTAEPLYVEAVSLYEALADEFSQVPAYHALLASTLNDHAENLRELGRRSEARQAMEQSVSYQQTYIKLRPGYGTRTLRYYERQLSRLTEPRKTDAGTDAEPAT